MKNSKIVDTLVSLLKDATSLKLKKKEILKADFVLFQTESNFIENCIYLNFAESETFMKKLTKKYKEVSKEFTVGARYNVFDIEIEIIQLQNQVQPFQHGNSFNGMTMQIDRVSVNSVNDKSYSVDYDPYFWGSFDEWYMKNRKKLLASSDDTKVKQNKNKKEKKTKKTKEVEVSADAMH